MIHVEYFQLFSRLFVQQIYNTVVRFWSIPVINFFRKC